MLIKIEQYGWTDSAIPVMPPHHESAYGKRTVSVAGGQSAVFVINNSIHT